MYKVEVLLAKQTLSTVRDDIEYDTHNKSRLFIFDSYLLLVQSCMRFEKLNVAAWSERQAERLTAMTGSNWCSETYFE
jgi:hypothetical protein